MSVLVENRKQSKTANIIQIELFKINVTSK